MTGGSQSVSHYTILNTYVHVTFHDGRTIVSKTIRTPDALKRALLNGALTTAEQPVPVA